VKTLDFLVALGTHQPMSAKALHRLVGISDQERSTVFSDVRIFNHEWNKPDTFITLGSLPLSEIEEIVTPYLPELDHDSGLLHEVKVTLNKLICDYDQLIICGPTFPHEVVGFSGGNKYFFPGISGSEVINYTHWLGAVITSFEVIGNTSTPVRKVINRAAAFIDRPKLCFSLVVRGTDLAGLYIGTPEEAYESAAELSSRVHIKYLDSPVKRVLSIMPKMYDDIWTAAKGLYKMEPVVADGGEVIVYAPHISEISYSHGMVLDEIGYHVRDYFLKQWERFRDYPGGVLAHSTHLRGLGEYDSSSGIESPRIQVTLATQIPEERCRQTNLGYRDPATIDPATWGNGKEDHLTVPKAGEILYRLKSSLYER
jgi:nickel-dependent lactate racemase